MVDVGTVSKIVEVALKIKRAADTVKQNEDVCKQIKSRVEILSNILSQHQTNTELMNNLAVRYALEALDEILVEAFKLVTDCQEETNFVCLFYTSGKMSRQLIQVEQRISSKNVDAILAIMGFLLPKQSNLDGANAPSPQVNVSTRPAPSHFEAMEPPNPPKLMHRLNQDSEDEFAHVDRSNPLPGDYFVGRPAQAAFPDVAPLDSSMEALCLCCAMARERKAIRPRPSTPDGQQRGLLDQIEEVALDIQEAVETVNQNRDDCIEIDKRVSRVSVLLSQLKNTDMVKEQAMKDALKKLMETFRHAHTLVMACQGIGIANILVCRQLTTKLSRQVRAVLDQLVPDINAMVSVIVNCTLRP